MHKGSFLPLNFRYRLIQEQAIVLERPEKELKDRCRMKITRGHVAGCTNYIHAHVSLCEVMPENGGLVFSGENFRFSSAFFADLLVEWMLTSRISLDKTFFQRL